MRRNRGDLHLGIALLMSLLPLIVLAAPELDDRDLIGSFLRDHFGGDLTARDERLADGDRGALADHQDLIELDGVAHGDFELLDPNALSGLARYCLPPVRKTAYTISDS